MISDASKHIKTSPLDWGSISTLGQMQVGVYSGPLILLGRVNLSMKMVIMPNRWKRPFFMTFRLLPSRIRFLGAQRELTSAKINKGIVALQ